MCLSSVSEIFKKPRKKKIIAWKTFRSVWGDPDKFIGVNYGAGKNKTGHYTVGKRYIAYGKVIPYTDYSFKGYGNKASYPAGFHAYASKKAAQDRRGMNTLRSVFIEDIVAIGKQGSNKTYIAKKMTILPIKGEKGYKPLSSYKK